MMKKKLVVLFMSALMVTSLTACGGDAPKQDEVKQESTQNEVADTDSDIEDAEEESSSGQELSDGDLRTITFEYFSYLQGELSEEDLKNDMTIYHLSLEEAKAVYEEHGAEYGYGSYEPCEEILNPQSNDAMLQIGDVVVHFPITLGELMEQTGAVVGDPTEARQLDAGFATLGSDHVKSTVELDGVGQSGYILLKTQDGSFLECDLRDTELKSVSDLTVYSIETGSRSVFAPGGIRTGLDMNEMDELLDTVYPSEFSDWEYRSGSGKSGSKVYHRDALMKTSVKMTMVVQLSADTNKVINMHFGGFQ